MSLRALPVIKYAERVVQHSWRQLWHDIVLLEILGEHSVMVFEIIVRVEYWREEGDDDDDDGGGGHHDEELEVLPRDQLMECAYRGVTRRARDTIERLAREANR
jgi:hypothetical protein